MGRIIVLAVVLLAAFVTGVVIGQTGGDDMVSTSALDAETSKVTQLQNQVAQLEGDLRTAREQLQVAQAAAPPPTDTRAGDPNSTTRGGSGSGSDGEGDGDSSSTTTKPKSSTTTTKSASESGSTGSWTTHTVKSGENLWSVANIVYGDAAYWRTIAEANGITSKTPLSPGRKLKIPPKPTSAGSSSGSSSSSSSSGSSSSGSSSSGSSVD